MLRSNWRGVELSGRYRSASARTLSRISALKQGLGAVDPYLGAADMTGRIGGQEGDEFANLLRRPQLTAGERNVALGILDRDFDVVILGVGVVGDLGTDRTWTDHIHPDFVWPEFNRQHLG